MPEPLIVIDRSSVREGRLEALEEAAGGLVEFVRCNEPRVILYQIFLDENTMTMTVVQVHPDSASMEHHLEAGASAFPQFADLLQMSAMEVYGRPSAELLERLTGKARMLGASGVVVHEPLDGLFRSEAA